MMRKSIEPAPEQNIFEVHYGQMYLLDGKAEQRAAARPRRTAGID